jgi:carboxyl-terminal processing protease
MLPATNRGAGASFGFPDPCLTPVGVAVVPLPYPNIGLHATATGFSVNVVFSGMNALNLLSFIPMTLGDEAGVAHPFIKQAGRFTMGNSVVHVNLVPGICLTCPTSGNNCNNALGAVLVPSITVVFFTYAGPGSAAPAAAPEGGPPDPWTRPLSSADLEALARELASTGREGGPPVEVRRSAEGVGVLAIRVFSADVPARVHTAVRDLSAEGLSALVLDLRDNPGGEARAFIELAGDFLAPGSHVVTVVDSEGDETVYRSWQERPYRMPLTILVNEGTASAAELFAECLAAHGRATVVGGPTYGKRVGQQVRVGLDGRAQAASLAAMRVTEGGG